MDNLKEVVELLLKVGKQNGAMQIEHVCAADGKPFALVPAGMEIKDLSEHIPANPDRKRVCVKLNSVISFIEYVNEHKSAHTRIFASMNEPPYTMTAAVDYHETGPDGKAELITHTAVLQLQETDEWKTWKGSDKKAFEHVEFALFIEENLLDVVDPDHADLLEVSMSLQVRDNGYLTSAHKLQDGSVHLDYKADIEAKAGVNGDLTIPEKITINIPVFRGVPAKDIEAYFRYRKHNGRLVLFYQLIRPQKLIDTLVETAIAQVRDGVELPVFDGSYSKA